MIMTLDKGGMFMRGEPKQPVKAAGPWSAAEVLSNHVLLEVEGIDRMYLNVYVPRCGFKSWKECWASSVVIADTRSRLRRWWNRSLAPS
jgi:hypothetical protein